MTTLVKLTASDGSIVQFDGPPPEIDDRVEVIIHQDTRTNPAVRVFVLRGRTRDLTRADRAIVRVFSEVVHLHAQVITPRSVSALVGIFSELTQGARSEGSPEESSASDWTPPDEVSAHDCTCGRATTDLCLRHLPQHYWTDLIRLVSQSVESDPDLGPEDRALRVAAQRPPGQLEHARIVVAGLCGKLTRAVVEM